MTHAIRQELFKIDPYQGVNQPLKPNIQGWNSQAPIFKELIEAKKPKLIVEVGSWLGASAIHMANACDDLKLDTHILCVDTWLGALEMWTDKEDPTRYGCLALVHGYPSLYRQFISNVIAAGHSERITPFPTTSSIAAKWLKLKQLRPDLAYIDASHSFEDVTRDLYDYWPLVNEGGVLFGDDYETWLEVRAAVNRFNMDFNVSAFNRLTIKDNHYTFNK